MDPYTESVLLVDPKLRGLRRVVADSDRVIFQICSECKGVPQIRKMRNCIDCDSMPSNAIKIIDVPPRKSAY